MRILLVSGPHHAVSTELLSVLTPRTWAAHETPTRRLTDDIDAPTSTALGPERPNRLDTIDIPMEPRGYLEKTRVLDRTTPFPGRQSVFVEYDR